MPRQVDLVAIYINSVVIDRNISDPTQINNMTIHYSVTDAAGVAYGGGIYTQALTTSQKTTLKNLLVNSALPAIRLIEGI